MSSNYWRITIKKHILRTVFIFQQRDLLRKRIHKMEEKVKNMEKSLLSSKLEKTLQLVDTIDVKKLESEKQPENHQVKERSGKFSS